VYFKTTPKHLSGRCNGNHKIPCSGLLTMGPTTIVPKYEAGVKYLTVMSDNLKCSSKCRRFENQCLWASLYNQISLGENMQTYRIAQSLADLSYYDTEQVSVPVTLDLYSRSKQFKAWSHYSQSWIRTFTYRIWGFHGSKDIPVIFWIIAPYHLVSGFESFAGTYCHHLQG
jgi:hypothetical protein